MIEHGRYALARLRPRDHTHYVSQGYTVLATQRDGFITAGPECGLFVHETRLLSRYRYLIDGKPPLPVALSNVEQHTWLGYYIQLPPDRANEDTDVGNPVVARRKGRGPAPLP